jgi:hypothetical protein
LLNTKAAEGAKQLSVVGTLVNFNAPKLLDDPEVYQPLKTNLEKARSEFNAIGFDIGEIMSTVAI